MGRVETALWRASQRVLAPGAGMVLRDRIRRWIRQHPGSAPRLDVGCGPRSRLAEAGFDAVGVDLHPGWGAINAEAWNLPFAPARFGSAWSFGLLHHLSREEAEAALREMTRVVRPGGHVVVFDGVLPEDRRGVALLIRRMDRGTQFRRQRDLERLLAQVGTWESERIDYARTGLEGVFAWMRNPGG